MLTSILDAPVACRKCDWRGVVEDCIADIDGDGSLGCPICGDICISTELRLFRCQQSVKNSVN